MTLSQATDLFSRNHQLTPRQHEVVCLIFDCRTPSQIAVQLGLTLNTVNNHRKAIYKRLGVVSVAGLFSLLLHQVLEAK